VVIHLSEGEQSGAPKPDELQKFESYDGKDPRSLDRDKIAALLIESGMWTALRQRPFSKVPQPGTTCSALFVTAIDSNPLAADPAVIIAEQAEAFTLGLELVSKLTDGPTYVCIREGAKID